MTHTNVLRPSSSCSTSSSSRSPSSSSADNSGSSSGYPSVYLTLNAKVTAANCLISFVTFTWIKRGETHRDLHPPPDRLVRRLIGFPFRIFLQQQAQNDSNVKLRQVQRTGEFRRINRLQHLHNSSICGLTCFSVLYE